MVANLSMESDQAENENIDKNMTDADNAKAPNTQVLELSLGETEYVRIPLTDDRRLELMQYSDRHYKGGIFSTIWDGGLGLLRYISDIYGHDWKHVTILDIGSGTGLVGLGAAVASQGKAVVAVTDLMQAMPLLYANIDLNQSNWPPGEGTHSPESGVMEWGKPISRLWLRQLLDRGSISTRGEERTVVITGADVVYRKSLFEPLLATLCELPTRVREFTEKEFTKLECLLAVQSIRSHVGQGQSIAFCPKHCRQTETAHFSFSLA